MRILVLVLFLAGCTGVAQMFDLDISPDARTAYENAGGTDIVLTDVNAINTVTINPAVLGTSFVVPLASCDASIDMAVKTPGDEDFWLAQSVTLNYDPSNLVCGTRYTINWSAAMVGTTAEVSFSSL